MRCSVLPHAPSFDRGSKSRTTHHLKTKPLKTAENAVPIIAKIMNAGIEAITHLTINVTIDKNGILISTTTTFLVSGSYISIVLVCCKTLRIAHPGGKHGLLNRDCVLRLPILESPMQV
jgi:hypothetical protein